MPKKLTSIQLWKSDRSAQIALPAGETILDSLVQSPLVRQKLGEAHELTLQVKSGLPLAIAKDDEAHALRQGKILRFVYDDSSVFEWRITQGIRDFSGGQHVNIKAKPLYIDLSKRIVRKTLSNNATRSSLSFYGQTVESVLSKLLSTDYNCPDYFALGTIADAVKKIEINEVEVDRKINLTLNAEYLMSALAFVCDQSNAEWDVAYNSATDKYEVNFLERGTLGGGEDEAGDRLITMGGERSNRLEMVRQDEDENYFSRIVPTAGQSNEVTNLADVTFGIGEITTGVHGTGPSTIFLTDKCILKDDYGMVEGEDVYFGYGANWFKVLGTGAKYNTVLVEGVATVLSGAGKGMFRIGANKDELIFIEDKGAVDQVGVIEQKYVRTDISPYRNELDAFGVSANLSEWSGGLPVGYNRIGGPETITEISDEIYVLYGGSSAKVSCDTNDGIETARMVLDPSNLNPYFSLSIYLRVDSGSVKVQLIDGDGNIYPEGEVAETNIAATRVLQIGGLKLAAGTYKIQVIGQEIGTEFYLDALTFTNSPAPVAYTPLMGKQALWTEASKYLARYGGDRPDMWRGKVFDEAYFDAIPTAKEIEIGSYVTIQEDYDGETYETERTARVVELQYHDSPDHGRVEKTVRLSESDVNLSGVLSEQYVSHENLQNVQSIESVPNQLIQGGGGSDVDENLFLRKDDNLAGVENKVQGRINMGLQIGTDIQAYSPKLNMITAMSEDQITGIQAVSAAQWNMLSGSSVTAAQLNRIGGDVDTVRANYGLGNADTPTFQAVNTNVHGGSADWKVAYDHHIATATWVSKELKLVRKDGSTAVTADMSDFVMANEIDTYDNWVLDVDGIPSAVNIGSGQQITFTGSGVNAVLDDGVPVITFTNTNTTYSVATTSSNGLMSSSDKTKLNGLDNYTLPPATSVLRGGIRVGDRLSIVGDVLSADPQTDQNFTSALKTKLDGIAPNANEYSLPIASATTLGGVKVGANLSILSGVLQGTPNTTYSAGSGLSLSGTTFSASLASEVEAETGTVTNKLMTPLRTAQAIAQKARHSLWVPSWGEVTGKPTSFTPSSHTHSASEITSGTLSNDRLNIEDWNSNSETIISLRASTTNTYIKGIQFLEGNNNWGTSNNYGMRIYYEPDANYGAIDVGNQTSINRALTITRNTGKVNFPSGASISSNDIWHAGNLTTTDISNWNTAYNDYVADATYTSQVLTLKDRSGGTIVTADLSGFLTSADNYYTNSAGWNSGTGVLSFSGVGGQPDYDVDLDGRYALSGSLTTHTANTSNPHSVSKSQVGLGNVSNYSTASEVEAETGTANDKFMTPLRTAQAIAQKARHSLWVPSWGEVTGKPTSFTPSSHSHTWAEVTGKPSTFNPSSHTHSHIHIEDVRDLSGSGGSSGYMPTPAEIGANDLRAYFYNDSTWWSVLTLKGWSSSYGVWQMRGNAHNSSGTNDDFYVRAGVGTTWGSWRKLWHSGNLTNNNQLTNGSGYYSSGSNPTFGTIIAGGSQIVSSAASLQVNGFIRTGNIYLHEGGNTPTSNAKPLSNDGGNLEWNNDTILHAGNWDSYADSYGSWNVATKNGSTVVHSQSVGSGQTVTFVGGDDISVSQSTREVTINFTGSVASYSGWNLTGGGVSRGSITNGETVTITGGSNVSIGGTGNEIIINSSYVNSYITGGSLSGSTLNLTGGGSAGASINLSGLPFASDSHNHNDMYLTLADWSLIDSDLNMQIDSRAPKSNPSFTGIANFASYVNMATYLRHSGDTNTQIGFPANDNISFFTAGSQRMRVYSNGYVRIGSSTSTPTRTLWVDGTAHSTGINYASDHQDSSDVRIKSNLEAVNPLEIADYATLYKYNKEGIEGIQYGLIAQDLMKYNSDITGRMTHERLGEIYTLSGYSVGSIALAGVRELNEKKAEKSEVEQLRQRVANLEQKVIQLGGQV